jgi:hypothetical protein
MRPLFLKLDDSLEFQGALGSAAEPDGKCVEARDIGRQIRLWGSPAQMLALEHRLRAEPAIAPEMVFAGSADFRGLTPLLLRRALRAAAAATAVIVCVRRDRDCDPGVKGSWLAEVAREPAVRRIVRARDLPHAVLGRTDIYVSIDTRALGVDGEVSFDELERLLGRIGPDRLIGAEIVGDWSTPDFGEGLPALVKRLSTLATRRPVDEWAERARDQANNVLLLSLFKRVTAPRAPVRLARAR